MRNDSENENLSGPFGGEGVCTDVLRTVVLNKERG